MSGARDERCSRVTRRAAVDGPKDTTGERVPAVPTGAAVRTKLPAKIRFEVLKRDKFACVYCGAKAPEVLLEVDHVVPVASGGTNDMTNLVTSCKSCNGGKGARHLSDDSAIAKQRTQLDELAKRREQLELMMQWQAGLLKIEEEEVLHVAEFWKKIAIGWALNESGRVKVRKMLRDYSSVDILRAMRVSVDQYGKFENGKLTSESCARAFSYVLRILRMTKADQENPYLKDYFYIRAILRNRFQDCDEAHALSVIREAHEVGVGLDDLKSFAKKSPSWSHWSRSMYFTLSAAKSAT